MKHFTLDQLAKLVAKVDKQCRLDYNNDALRIDLSNYSFTKVSRVGNNVSINRDYSLAYYLIRHPLVYDYLIKFYEANNSKLLTAELERRAGAPNSKLDKEVLDYLVFQINSAYLYKKLQDVKSGKSSSNLAKPYKDIFPLYLKEVDTRTEWTTYEGFYCSTKGPSIEPFDLKIDLKNRRAKVSGLHDDKSISYEGAINGEGNQLFLNLVREDSREAEQLNLILNKGNYKLEKLNDISGSFSGVSFSNDISIGGEFVLLREQLLKDCKHSRTAYELYIKKHLNLHRNSFRVHKGGLFNQRDYKLQYGYKLDVLKRFTGEYLVGRLQNKTSLIVGVLKINEDYSATLTHPEIEDKRTLHCPIKITKTEREQALLLEVFAEPEYAELEYEYNNIHPFALAMIDLPLHHQATKNVAFGKRTLLGCFCNIYGGEPMGGNLVLLKLPQNIAGNPERVNILNTKNPQYMKLWDELVSRNPFLDLKKLKKKLFGASN